MAGVLALAADGFEEIELLTVVDVLRRAGVRIHIASISEDSLMVQGGHDIVIQADILLQNAALDTYDWLYMPGGSLGVQNLEKSAAVQHLLKNWSNRHIAAICAAPMVLSKAGLLQGVVATGYPSTRAVVEAGGAQFSEANVVTDERQRKIVTSRGPATALEFALYLVREIAGSEMSREIATKMLVNSN